jgi:hypothetical protein
MKKVRYEMCIYVKETRLAKRKTTVYGVSLRKTAIDPCLIDDTHEEAVPEDCNFVSIFAYEPVIEGDRTVVCVYSDRLAGCQEGFNRFMTLKEARLYRKEIGERCTYLFDDLVILKSVIKKGELIEWGYIDVNSPGSGLPAIRVQHLHQTLEEVE